MQESKKSGSLALIFVFCYLTDRQRKQAFHFPLACCWENNSKCVVTDSNDNNLGVTTMGLWQS